MGACVMPAAGCGSDCGGHQPWRGTQPGDLFCFVLLLVGPVGWLSVPEGWHVSGGAVYFLQCVCVHSCQQV